MRSVYLFTFATLITGLGWLALLPPMEGFDETAHFSYIQQIADTGTIPVFGNSFLSRDVQRYREQLPTPYASMPPFDSNGAITYQRFFGKPVSADARRELTSPRRFAPSAEPNWQSQHPPLYYLAMAPLYRVSAAWSWPAQFLLMRVVSWLIAMTGLVLGIVAAYRYWPDDDRAAAATVSAAWPFLVPMFFPEMARLGNDSLCLLVAGAVWYVLMRMVAVGARRRDAALLGVLLGLGLLTKAFFLPITGGVIAFLALRREFRIAGIALALAALVGGPWYIYKFLSYGVATGAYEQVLLAEQGGLLAGLAASFNVTALAHGIAGIVATTSWAGTWSLARLPDVFRLPLVLLLAIPLGAYTFGLIRTRVSDIVWAPVWIVGAVVAGLVHHVLVRIALSGEGTGTPGWYLHLLAGPLGFAYAVGVLRMTRWKIARLLLLTLSTYTLGYFAVVSWLQLLMYSGCVAKVGAVKYYGLPTGASCMTDVVALYRRLSLIAEPAAGLAFLALGLTLGGFALTSLPARLRRAAN